MHAHVSLRESLNLLGPDSADPQGLRHHAVRQLLAAGDDVSTALRNQLAREGLTVEGFQTLLALQREPVPPNPGKLAHQLGTTRALLSHVLNRLEFSRLIRRQRGSKDRRVVWVTLTPQGFETINRASATCNHTVLQLVRLFDDGELVNLAESTHRLSKCAAVLR